MSDNDSDWMKGIRAALKAAGFSEDNNIAIGMAHSMRAGRDEASFTLQEGREMGAEVARRCKYGKR
ncbi:MAG: hypothetical protein RL477_398 [Pseudomonadota bacterium]|jgi:hypothetical protein